MVQQQIAYRRSREKVTASQVFCSTSDRKLMNRSQVQVNAGISNAFNILGLVTRTHHGTSIYFGVSNKQTQNVMWGFSWQTRQLDISMSNCYQWCV